MGGLGSGEYRVGKITTDASIRIDIRFMRKQGWLVPGRNDVLSWNIGGKPFGSIGYRVYEDNLELQYSCTPYGKDNSKSIRQHIFFDETDCHYGGTRKWLLCPDCSSRRDVLYMNGCYFTCRTCANLDYQSQHEQALDRNYRAARKIRHQLKTETFNPDNLSERIIFKPKGMHQSTFFKLKWKQAQYINISMQQLKEKLSWLFDKS